MRCQYCSNVLRSENARQCVACGSDWHDPDNIVHPKCPATERAKYLASKAEKFLDAFRRGIYSENEAVSAMEGCITELNVSEVVSSMPQSFQLRLREWVEQAPETDSEWDNYDHIVIRSYCGPLWELTPTADQIEEEYRLEKEEFRRRTNLLREHFASRWP